MKNKKKSNNIVIIIIVTLIIIALTIIIISTYNNKKHKLEYINEAVYAATRMFITDPSNEVILKSQCNNQEYASISKIKYGNNLTLNVIDDKIFVNFLTENYYLSIPDIKKEEDVDAKLNEEKSYVIVKYDCKNKEYIYADFSYKQEKEKSWMEWE